jgi:hypothetical protein
MGCKHRSLISSWWDSNIILCRWEIRPISSAGYVEKYGVWSSVLKLFRSYGGVSQHFFREEPAKIFVHIRMNPHL